MNATLLCVVMLVPGYGEKEIIKRIVAAGGQAGTFVEGGTWVKMPEITTDADLGDLCELRGLLCLDLSFTKVNDEDLRTVSALRGLTSLTLDGTAITDRGLRHLEPTDALRALLVRFCRNVIGGYLDQFQKTHPKCTIAR